MSHPYDAGMKDLIERMVPHWLPLIGRPVEGTATPISADLSTVTASTDKVLLIEGPVRWLLNLEIMTYWDPLLPCRLNEYGSLLEYRHHLLVWTVLLLMRPEADSPRLTGIYERSFPGEEPYRWFRYHTVRIWQMPASTFLNGGVGLMPLAPLSNVTPNEIPGLIRRMDERFRQELSPIDANRMWTTTGTLMGLRFAFEDIAPLLEGVYGMRESTFFQGAMREGSVLEARNILLRQGRKKFGPTNRDVEAALNGIADVLRLEALADRLLDVSSWDELLATP